MALVNVFSSINCLLNHDANILVGVVVNVNFFWMLDSQCFAKEVIVSIDQWIRVKVTIFSSLDENTLINPFNGELEHDLIIRTVVFNQTFLAVSLALSYTCISVAFCLGTKWSNLICINSLSLSLSLSLSHAHKDSIKRDSRHSWDELADRCSARTKSDYSC